MISSTRVLWTKVWGIATVQAAITLSWVIYNLYLPLMLVEFGFSKELAISILIFENALESIIEPIFGGLSDRQEKLLGSKIPLISTGIIVSSALFILFPCLIIFNLEQYLTKWSLPILAIIWASVMAVFRAPTIALLGRCAKKDNLPQAASILTLVGSVAGAFRFDAFGLILNLGSSFAFAFGSFSLLFSAFILNRLNPEYSLSSPPKEFPKISLLLLSLIFTMGIWISWSIKFITPTVSAVLKLQFGAGNGKIAMTIYFILLGLAALPAGKIASKFNNQNTMPVGAIGTVISLVSLAFLPNKTLPIVLLIICFSLVLNGITPLILNLVPQSRSGLGLGIYFGGFGAGLSIFDLILKPLKITNFEINAIAGVTVLALICSWFVLLDRQSV